MHVVEDDVDDVRHPIAEVARARGDGGAAAAPVGPAMAARPPPPSISVKARRVPRMVFHGAKRRDAVTVDLLGSTTEGLFNGRR
ncbi:MAG TPA: hypothetical protein VFG00_02555 [Acidothermaceae bacterium]|nr:hypothetical protein [Acidothermaceae bacterium]